MPTLRQALQVLSPHQVHTLAEEVLRRWTVAWDTVPPYARGDEQNFKRLWSIAQEDTIVVLAGECTQGFPACGFSVSHFVEAVLLNFVQLQDNERLVTLLCKAAHGATAKDVDRFNTYWTSKRTTAWADIPAFVRNS